MRAAAATSAQVPSVPNALILMRPAWTLRYRRSAATPFADVRGDGVETSVVDRSNGQIDIRCQPTHQPAGPNRCRRRRTDREGSADRLVPYARRAVRPVVSCDHQEKVRLPAPRSTPPDRRRRRAPVGQQPSQSPG
jgi:hypothetical protein